MDKIGLDLLEEKRREQRLKSVREIATHVSSFARKGLGIDDPARIDLREIGVKAQEILFFDS